VQLSSYTKNPHVVAGLMKMYLARLPQPLLTFGLYDSFLAVLSTCSLDRYARYLHSLTSSVCRTNRYE